MIIPPICPYCKQPSVPATGKDIYPHRPDLHDKRLFVCTPCGAYVGTHTKTGEPLGTPAKAELRKLRNQAHEVFDPIWTQAAGREKYQDQKALARWKPGSSKPVVHPIGYYIKKHRTDSYALLAKAMDISVENCHIGVFTEDQCRKVIQLCNSREIFSS